MTKNIIYFDGGKITKTRLSYKVTFEEDNCTIFIPKADVDEFQSICHEDEYLLSVLLGYIESIRRSTITDQDYIPKIEIPTLSKGFTSLLLHHPIEKLIYVFSNLKWHEISGIINADNPVDEISNFI